MKRFGGHLAAISAPFVPDEGRFAVFPPRYPLSRRGENAFAGLSAARKRRCSAPGPHPARRASPAGPGGAGGGAYFLSAAAARVLAFLHPPPWESNVASIRFWDLKAILLFSHFLRAYFFTFWRTRSITSSPMFPHWNHLIFTLFAIFDIIQSSLHSVLWDSSPFLRSINSFIRHMPSCKAQKSHLFPRLKPKVYCVFEDFMIIIVSSTWR